MNEQSNPLTAASPDDIVGRDKRYIWHPYTQHGTETDPLVGTDAQLMLRPPYQGLGEIRLLEVAGPVIPLTSTPKRAAELVSTTTAGPAPR